VYEKEFQNSLEPPFGLNPLTHIWRTIHPSRILTHSFLEYIKHAKMTIIHVLGSVKDEQSFSYLAFLKNKLRATLYLHLPLVVTIISSSLWRFFYILLYLMLGLEHCYIWCSDWKNRSLWCYCIDKNCVNMLFCKATQLLAPSYLVNFLHFQKLNDVFYYLQLPCFHHLSKPNEIVAF
jgi:hypothetical protein